MNNSDLRMSICRGCLADDGKMASATLYEAEFKDLTGITISPSDMLPQWLCYECIALLQKCVRFRNKVMRSHYTLCKYVLEDVPFVCDKDDNPHLSRSTILHHDIPGTQTIQPEDLIENSAVNDIVISNIESVKVKDEIVASSSKDNITGEECPEHNYHDIMDVARKSSPCYLSELETSDIRLVISNHEKQTEQREVEEQISPGVADTDLKTVEVKHESSSPDHDDIIIEEWCIDQPNELKSRSSISKLDQEEQEQTASELVRTGTCAACHSVRALEHLHEHTDSSSTLRKEIDGENFKSNVISDDSVDGNSCSNVKLYICDKCNKYFDKNRLLVSHLRDNSKQKSNQMPYKSGMKCFIPKYPHNGNTYKGEKLYKCDVCMKSFTTSSTYKGHMRIHTGEKPYKCDVCMKSFTTSSTYKEHMRIHTGEKPYKCDVCMKSFATSSPYKIHMRIHTGEKPFKCDVCMKCFTTQFNCNVHKRIHTGEKPYKCDICIKSFTTLCIYKTHMRIHTGEKPYKCDICIKSFTTLCIYKAHMRIHTGEKPYKCDICIKSFTTLCIYKAHMRIHTGEKPYKCDICMKSFTTLCIYKAHMRIHTGEKPYKCDICMKSFTTLCIYKAHMRIHTGEKPYKCDICMKCFTTLSNYNSHMRIHKGEKP